MADTKGAGKIRQIFVCVFFSLFFYGFVSAQYRFDNWTTENGLPQNSVNGVIQSKDGYIWGVTNGGIFRFDGVRFTVFNKSNTKGLAESRFLRIKEDREGRIWFLATSNSLAKYENGRFETYLKDKDFGRINFNQRLLTDENGNLIFSTDKGFFRYSGGKFIRFEIPTQTSQSKICFVDKQGVFWLTDNTGITGDKNRGLRRVAGEQVEYFTFPREQPYHSAIPFFYEDKAGNLWIIHSPSAVYRFHSGEMQVYENLRFVWSFAEDLDGNLWMGKTGGFNRLDADQVNNKEIDFSRLQELSPLADFDKNMIHTLAVDREGGVWMGTFNSGLIYAAPKIFKVYSKEDWKTENDVVYPIFEDSKKNVWLGIWYGGLIKYGENNRFNVLNPEPVNREPTALFEDSQQRIWIGAIGSIGYFKDEKFVELPLKETFLDFSTNVFLDFQEETDGSIWMATEKGLVKYEGQNSETFTKENGLADSFVTKLLKTKNGDLWIGSRGGLTVYSNGKFVVQNMKDVLEEDHIRNVYEDAEGTIWIGTYDDGIIRYKDGIYKRISKSDGLFSENAFCTLEDENGWFWVNTNNGIYRVRKQQLNDFADGKIERVQSISYNKKDGLLNLEGNGGKQPAGIKRSNGELWFPTQKGVAIVDPNEIPVNKLPPPVHLEEISIDKKDIGKYGETVEIQPGQENLEIHYTGISFTNSELVNFRYRLEGLEEHWNEAGARRTAFYNNIPPGDYMFRVIAANRDDVWNAEGATIKVKKLPYYYQTWWFLVLSILTAFGIIFYIFYERISHFRQIAETKTKYSRRLIESQEAERKRLASELHDGLGQELIIIKNRAMLAINEDEDKEAMEKEIKTISETAANALIGIREITNNLRPQTLDRLGLTKALKAMVRNISNVIEIESEIGLIDNLVSKDEEINIYRIVQESLNNIIKHSNAENALVEIKREEKNISIIIKDNGNGFDTAKVKSEKGGLGLIGLKERTQLLGGEILIDSKIGQGTTIQVSIPL